MARGEILGPADVQRLLDQRERAEAEKAKDITKRAADALTALVKAYVELVGLLGPDKTEMILTVMARQLPPKKVGAKKGPRDAKVSAELLAIYDGEAAWVPEEDRKHLPRTIAKRLIADGCGTSEEALRKQIDALGINDNG